MRNARTRGSSSASEILATALSNMTETPTRPTVPGMTTPLHAARKIVTLTAPGLLFQHGVAETTARRDPGVLLLRHEDIVRKPRLVQLALAKFTGLELHKKF